MNDVAVKEAAIKAVAMNETAMKGAATNDARRDDSPRDSSPPEHVIFTDLDGAAGVLVDLDTKQYYQLNETASVVWRELTSGKAATEIVDQMTTAYDVTPAHAQVSVDTLLRELRARRLLR
jgi:hypothetical protein